MQRSRSKGFTLIELVIVVAIISVLAAFAYYNYSRYAMRARRADGKNLLTAAAAAEERYYTNYNKYTTTIASLGTSTTSDKGYYTLSITNGGDTSKYILTATPNAPQNQDTGCMNLILDNTGAKSQSASTQTNGPCW